MSIEAYLKQYSPLPGFDWSAFLAQLHYRQLGKKDILIRTGHIENNLYFLEEGILRFYVEKEHKEITFDFAFPLSFFAAYSSFLTGEPSLYSIQALTNCKLYFISRHSLEELYQSHSAALAMGKWSAEQQFLKKSAREFSLLMQSAEERYLSLLEKQPILIEQIPMKYLASYIGITPQALSRIRKRVSTGQRHK